MSDAVNVCDRPLFILSGLMRSLDLGDVDR
jgi:hypothetical protein